MRRTAVGMMLIAGFMALALPASAGEVQGDCVADQITGTSYDADGLLLDTKTVGAATRSDPFLIDRAGEVAWEARTTSPITDHTWRIGPVIGGIDITLFSGGDPNTAGTQESTGRFSVAERLDDIQTESVGWISSSLVGIVEVWGEISGDGSCSGRAWVKIEGSPLGGILGQGSLGAAVVGAGMLVLAARKKA